MSSYGIGTVSSDIPTEDNRTEAELAEGRLENEKETIIVQKTNERLRKLTPDDRMYEAMENFLLGDPESQIQLLGTKEEILGKADEARSKGENLIARAQYETMAKVAIYQQNADLTKKSLDLAATVTDPSDKHATMQKTIEGNVNQVIKIARDYYQTKEKITAETEAEVSAAAMEEKK
jgi:hypothetical protein